MNKYSFSSNFLSVHTFQCKGPKTCLLYLLKTTKHNESFPVIGKKKEFGAKYTFRRWFSCQAAGHRVHYFFVKGNPLKLEKPEK